MKKSRKVIALVLNVVLAMGVFTGCGGNASRGQEISVVSREDGSGTRGAFVELTGVEEKEADGSKIDNTTPDAIISNSTQIVMTTVAGNEASIGYISLGSLNEMVKGVKVDDVEPTAENINNGTYQLSRPFNIVTKGKVEEMSKAAKDFIDFIMSADGQKVISDSDYIEVENSGAFFSNGASGKIVIAGSSSVTPVMEKLTESYKLINTKVEIEVQESDSTTGITSVADGTCDIGMASRGLDESEVAKGLETTAIAMDGIVVIVNNKNNVESLDKSQINDIFRGNVTDWSEVRE